MGAWARAGCDCSYRELMQKRRPRLLTLQCWVNVSRNSHYRSRPICWVWQSTKHSHARHHLWDGVYSGNPLQYIVLKVQLQYNTVIIIAAYTRVIIVEQLTGMAIIIWLQCFKSDWSRPWCWQLYCYSAWKCKLQSVGVGSHMSSLIRSAMTSA